MISIKVAHYNNDQVVSFKRTRIARALPYAEVYKLLTAASEATPPYRITDDENVLFDSRRWAQLDDSISILKLHVRTWVSDNATQRLHEEIRHRIAGGVMGMRPQPQQRQQQDDDAKKMTLPMYNVITERAPADEWELIATTTSSSSANPPTPTTITVWVNGEKYTIENPSPDMLLVDWLRRGPGKITSVKVGCNEGGCGACTVCVTYKDSNQTTVTVPINACLRPLLACDGYAITTAYGIGNSVTGFHEIQTALASHDGSQCGFCSPGMVMNMYGLLQQNPKPTAEDIETNFDGNICRCTGYRAILSGMQTFAAQPRLSLRHDDDDDDDEKAEDELVVLNRPHECVRGTCCDVEDVCAATTPTTPPPASALPAGFMEYESSRSFVLRNTSTGDVWCNATSIDDIFMYLNTYQGQVARLVAGNTAFAVAKYYEPSAVFDDPSVYINMTTVPSLCTINASATGLTFGAAVSINAMRDALQAHATQGGSVYAAIARHLGHVANNQVRNAGSWAGNFMLHKTHVNFPSDILNVMAACDAIITLQAANGDQTVMSVRQFITFTLPTPFNSVIIVSLFVPFTVAGEYFDSWKVADRHQNAHALINAGFKLVLEDEVIKAANIVIGGLGGGYFFADKTVSSLVGAKLSPTLLATAVKCFNTEAVPPPPPPGPLPFKLTSPAFRKSLATTLFYKFLLSALATFITPNPVPVSMTSGYEHYVRAVSSGTEVFYPDESESPVSEGIHKLGALVQAAGEAQYTDDVNCASTCVECAYVMSTVPAGTITSIDASQALTMPGVKAFISAADVLKMGGTNSVGMFPGDEELFASKEVTYIGQPIGLIAADSYQQARLAAKAVVVTYGAPTYTPVFDIPSAIAAGSFLKNNQYMKHMSGISRGNMGEGFADADLIISGDVYTYQQYHFYMEVQTSLAVPEEDNTLRVYTSSQGPAPMRAVLAGCLNKPSNKIIVSTKRAGGGFGGKLTRANPPAAAVSVAATLLSVPARIAMSRNDDMMTMGKRASTYASYRLGLKNDGTITAYAVDFYWQASHSYDTSFGSFDMMQLWADNTYFIPNYSSTGKCVMTNHAPGTAMRAPGALQGVYILEEIIERAAFQLGMSPYDIRTKNFYQVGDTTPYLQPLEYVSLQTVWSQLLSQSDFEARSAAVAQFNQANQWRKRGIHCTPVKYPIAVWGYQASVQINVMGEDGTVMITHSGCEIGQGINTKVVQAVAFGLKIPISNIVVSSTSTEKIPNFQMTGGSATSETHVQAALNACEQLNDVLKPFRADGDTWAETVAKANGAFANLSVTGYFAMTGGPSGFPFTYFVYCAACSEVEVDILTGQVEILRVDIVYDCGTQLNGALDIGQVEGAFVQGIGYFFTEDVYFDDGGRLVSNGTWDYKPPQSLDIPVEFNCTFLKDTPNEAKFNVMSSKATGEPPYQLAISAFFAAKDAIRAASSNADVYLNLSPPLTVDKVQQACGVTVDQLVV